MKLGRNKVVLIKGWAKLAPEITLGEYERINADYVALITALRYPQLLPDEYSGFEADPTSMYTNIKDIINNWALQEMEHVLAGEYANYVVDRGGEKVRAVEGISLEINWFYDTIRNYHRHFGQSVVDCEVVYHREEGVRILIDEKPYTRDEAIKRLQPLPNLG